MCYGCSGTLSSERYKLYNPSHAKALSMWKKLALERFDEIGVNIDIDEILDENNNSCDLDKLEKLNSAL